MSVGVVPHYRPCLLVNCHCNRYFTSRVQMEEWWLQVWCYLHRGAIISGMHDALRIACFYNPTISDMRAGFMNSFTHVCKCCFIRQGIRSDSNIYAGEMPVTNLSDMPTGRMLHPQGCKTCRVPSWMPS